MERLGRLQEGAFSPALLVAMLSLICQCHNNHATSSSPFALSESCDARRLEPGASAALSASFDRWEQRSQQRRASAMTKKTFLRQAACLMFPGPDDGRASAAGGHQHGPLRHEAAGLHEGSAVEVEIARRGSASQSSTAVGKLGIQSPAKAAIDGQTLGFGPSLMAGHVTPVAQRLMQAYPVSQTNKGEQGGSWWALDLEEAVVVTSVEAWPPRSVSEAVRTGRRRETAEGRGRVAAQPRSLRASLSLEAGQEAAGVEAWEHELPWGHTWAALQLFQPARRLSLRPAAGAASKKSVLVGSTKTTKRKDRRVGGGGGLSIAEVRVHAVVPWECHRYCVHGTCQCTGSPENKDPSECPRTLCVCEPDWAGLQCDTFIQSAWEHLPRSLPLGPSPWWEASGLSSSLTGRVSELQQPRGCPAAMVSYPDLMQSGLGSSLMLMSAALSDAVVQGRTFVPPESVQFAARARECEGRRGFECYFKPWANLDVSCSSQQGRQPPEKSPNRVGGTACNNGTPSCSRMNVTVAPYSAMGRFWWRAHLMEYLFRMSKGLRRSLDLEALKERIGFRGPIIGVHIRHGDSCFLARSGYCRPVSDYIPAVLSAAARYNISRAFVATDDPAVIRELRARAKTDGIEWLFLPINRESLDDSKPSAGPSWGMSVENRMRRGELPVYQTTIASLQDILLQSESDVLIGTGSASFFKVALLLSAARKRALPPYVSLDAAYCDSWRMCCNVMPDGSSVTC